MLTCRVSYTHTLQVRLQQLEAEFAARLRAERMRPAQGVEERMAMYRQEIDEQAKAEVQRQVGGGFSRMLDMEHNYEIRK